MVFYFSKENDQKRGKWYQNSTKREENIYFNFSSKHNIRPHLSNPTQLLIRTGFKKKKLELI